MEEAVPEGLLTGCTDEAGGMPCLPQGMHHFLGKRASVQDRKIQRGEGGRLDVHTRPWSRKNVPSGSRTGSAGSGPQTHRGRLGVADEGLLLTCWVRGSVCVLIKAVMLPLTLNLGGRLLTTAILPKEHQVSKPHRGTW